MKVEERIRRANQHRPERPYFLVAFECKPTPIFPALVDGDNGAADLYTQLWADDEHDAERICKARNMGEQLDLSVAAAFLRFQKNPPTLPSEWWDAKEYTSALHAACWLSSAALASGAATWREITGDSGVIHGMAHLLLPRRTLAVGDNHEIETAVKAHMADALRDLERRTPGFGKYRSDPNP